MNKTVMDVAHKITERQPNAVKARGALIAWILDNLNHKDIRYDVAWYAAEYCVERSRQLNNRSIREKLAGAPGVETVSTIDPDIGAEVSARISRSANAKFKHWYKTFVGAKRLVDCTKEDLETAASHDAVTAYGNVRNAIFYGKIAAGLKGKQTVGKVFTEEQLSELYEASKLEARKIIGAI